MEAGGIDDLQGGYQPIAGGSRGGRVGVGAGVSAWVDVPLMTPQANRQEVIAAVDTSDPCPNIAATGITIGSWVIGYSTLATFPDFPVPTPNRRINSNFLFELPRACVADVDDGSGTGTGDGAVTLDDLLYFLQRFEEGC